LARLSIPEKYRKGLASIRSIPEAGIEEIRAILDRAWAPTEQADGESSAPSDPGVIVASIRSVRPAISIENFAEVMDAILSLYAQKAQRDVSTEKLVDEVSDAMEQLEGDLRLPHNERINFAGKLLTLLNASPFALFAKAYDLKTEDERLFCHARILTDLRPIFGGNVEDGPQAMIVTHMLKIGFHEQGNLKQHREFFVSLDADDLRELREIVDRAEKKARTLSSVVKNVRVFGLSEE
jgi:hypothetical protein